MAHSFLKNMAEAENGRFGFQVTLFTVGSLLLFLSYLSAYLFRFPEVSALPAMVSALLFGIPLLYHAFRDMLSGQIEMNELAALSFVASFSTSQYQTAAVIALFIIVAQLIETRSKIGARKNIEALMRLAPEKVSVLSGETTTQKPIDSLCEGDLLLVLPGDHIPGDGIVVEGVSTVDEANVTGESMPVEKRPQEPVYGGTMNVDGKLIVRVLGSASESTLSKIKKLITQAEESRTPITRIVNKYAAWYVPLIVMLAGIVFFFTGDIDRFISVLIIGCPCIVLTAAPATYIAAISAATRAGVIIRDMSSLETAGRVNCVVFDKTGTLTHGSLVIETVTSCCELSTDELLQLACAAESDSRHPTARAVMAGCAVRGIPVPKSDCFREWAGQGVSAEVSGQKVAVGRKEWIRTKCEIPDTAEISSAVSALHIALDSAYAGFITLNDSLKLSAPEVVDRLRQLSIKNITMLTGDRLQVAKSIAGKLDCSFEAGLLPGDKMNKVKKLKEKGYRVAVIGDGVNDAPALASGDFSVAMGMRGSDVSVHSASVVLMNDKLDRIPFIIQLSRKVRGVVNQNLFFSSLFIVVLIILSSLGHVSPISAAVLHILSILFIVFNSARLFREGRKLQ
ncbi:MAG: heavy metal translocating P-type ATPase [Chitinispirillaceae bacterium]